MKLTNVLRWLCCVICLWSNYSIADDESTQKSKASLYFGECPLTKQGDETKKISESLKQLKITPPQGCNIDTQALESAIAQAKALAKTDDAQIDILKSIQDGDTLTSIQATNLQAQIDGLTKSITAMAGSWNPNNDKCNDGSFLASLSNFFQSMAGISSVINSGYAVPMTVGSSFLSSIISAVDRIFKKKNYGFDDEDPSIAGENRNKFLSRLCALNDIVIRYKKADRLGRTDECQFAKRAIEQSPEFSCYDKYLNLGNEQAKQLQQIADTIQQHLAQFNNDKQRETLCFKINAIFDPNNDGKNTLDTIHKFYSSIKKNIDPSDNNENDEKDKKDKKDGLAIAEYHLNNLKKQLAALDCSEKPEGMSYDSFNDKIKQDIKNIQEELKEYRGSSSNLMVSAKKAMSEAFNQEWSNKSFSEFIKSQTNETTDSQSSETVSQSSGLVKKFIVEELGKNWEDELDTRAKRDRPKNQEAPFSDKVKIVHNILQRRILRIEDALALQKDKENTSYQVKVTTEVTIEAMRAELIDNQTKQYLKFLDSKIAGIYAPIPEQMDFNIISKEKKQLDDQANVMNTITMNKISYTSFLAKIELCEYLYDCAIEIAPSTEVSGGCAAAFDAYENQCKQAVEASLTQDNMDDCTKKAQSIQNKYINHEKYNEEMNKPYKNPCVTKETTPTPGENNNLSASQTPAKENKKEASTWAGRQWNNVKRFFRRK